MECPRRDVEHRTNNVAEGWNNRLRNLVGHHHPSVWTADWSLSIGRQTPESPSSPVLTARGRNTSSGGFPSCCGSWRALYVRMTELTYGTARTVGIVITNARSAAAVLLLLRNHRLRGSASTVLTATGQINGRWQILTPHRIETHEPTATKFRTSPREDPLNQIWYKSIHWGLQGIWVKITFVCLFYLFIYLYLFF